MRANLMMTASESGPVFGWFNTAPTSMESLGQCADQFSQRPNLVLHLRFQGETTLEQRTEVIRNYLALISKAWRFLFPTSEAPNNPWISGLDVNYESLGDHSGAVRTDYESGFVEIRLGRQTPIVLQSLTWRLSNAFEWCMLSDRRRLSGRSPLSRETWDAISVNQDSTVLKRNQPANDGPTVCEAQQAPQVPVPESTNMDQG